jgi:hypothetical protein|tara:strand:+ start:157 stop:426 length:270 start_codon:yes stop_codon:yes gene_type:complete
MVKLSTIAKATYSDKNNIQKGHLRLFKIFNMSTRMDSNFGNHLWFDFRVGPMEFSTGFRMWDESPEALEQYKEDFNIFEMDQNPNISDA